MPSPSAQPARKRSFPVYDNMSYIGKPDTKPYGLIPSNIIAEGRIWPHGQNYGVLPSRSSFDAIVAANMSNPGPIVLDIEKLPLKGSPHTVRQHLQVLATLADWTRADAKQGRRVLRLQHPDRSAIGRSDLRAAARPSCRRVLPIDVHLRRQPRGMGHARRERSGGRPLARSRQTGLFLPLASVPRRNAEAVSIHRRRLLAIPAQHGLSRCRRYRVVGPKPLPLG